MLQDEVGEEALARFVGASIRRRYLDLLLPRNTAEAVPRQWHGAGPGMPCPACLCGYTRLLCSLLTACIELRPHLSVGGPPAAQ